MDVNLTQMVGGSAGDTHISEPSLAEGYFFSHDHLAQLVTRPHAKVEYRCGVRGGKHVSPNQSRDMCIPSIFLLFELSLAE